MSLARKVENNLTECAILIIEQYKKDKQYYSNNEDVKNAIENSAESFGKNFTKKILDEAEEKGLL